jgi:hypothetical protein
MWALLLALAVSVTMSVYVIRQGLLLSPDYGIPTRGVGYLGVDVILLILILRRLKGGSR